MSVLQPGGAAPRAGGVGEPCYIRPVLMSELSEREEGAEELVSGSEPARRGSWFTSRADM